MKTHPIDILEKEHEIILENLDKLREYIDKVQEAKSLADVGNLDELKHIVHVLLEAEPHHEREEKVLFPKLEALGVDGPTTVMRMEHEEFRPKKKSLATLLAKAQEMDFSEFKEKFLDDAQSLVNILPNHISKENNILYPEARHLIKEADWPKIRADFDKIGYCCFTPKDL